MLRALGWLSLALVVGLFAPLAAAQAPVVQAQLSVAVEDPARALSPGRVEPLVVLLNYRVGAGALAAPGSDPLGEEENATQPTRVTLSAKAFPSWVDNVTFDPPIVEIFVPQGSVATNYPARATALVGVRADAPALERQDFIVVGTAEPNGNMAGASGESPALKIRAAFIAKVNVSAPAGLVVPGGRWFDMPFTLRNDGNTETKVLLNVTARPQDSQVEFPTSVTIPRGGVTEVAVRLRVPWTVGEGGIVELTATPLTETDEGRPSRAEIEVFGQSAVPPAGVAWLVAGGALAARWVRRRG